MVREAGVLKLRLASQGRRDGVAKDTGTARASSTTTAPLSTAPAGLGTLTSVQDPEACNVFPPGELPPSWPLGLASLAFLTLEHVVRV